MRVWQKILLGFVFLLLVGVVGATTYVAKIYSDVRVVAAETYESIDRLDSDKGSIYDYDVDYSQLEPISILLMGIDTNSEREGDGDGGRTDSMIVATVNPKKGQTTLVSIPRDTLVEMDYEYDGYSIGYDKINAAYAYGGAPLAIDTVEDLLGIPINYYATVDMDGMVELIDAVGGIEVYNENVFELDGEYFEIGQQHLNGIRAVQYARMRYQDVLGDYGRQERQREVLEKVFDKVTSFNTLTNYQDLLNVVGKNGKTNLTWENMKSLIQKYTPALKTFTSDQLQGEDYEGDGVVGVAGGSYQYMSYDEIKRVHELLAEQLGQGELKQTESSEETGTVDSWEPDSWQADDTYEQDDYGYQNDGYQENNGY